MTGPRSLNKTSHPAALDHRYVWHPFTQMRDWLKREPVTIVSGHGAVLQDAHGREYLDANSSIWTNLHGHRHPKINAAIRRQIQKISHSSALGLANEPASRMLWQENWWTLPIHRTCRGTSRDWLQRCSTQTTVPPQWKQLSKWRTNMRNAVSAKKTRAFFRYHPPITETPWAR